MVEPNLVNNIGFWIFLAIALFVLGAIVIFSTWISYKRTKELPNPKTNPFILAIIAVAVTLIIPVFLMAVGYLDKEWVQEHWWLFAGMAFVIAFAIIYMNLKQKRIPFEKLYSEAMEMSYKTYNATPVTGYEYGHALKMYKLLDNPSTKSKFYQSVAVFYLHLKSPNPLRILVFIDVLSRSIISIEKDPPQSEIYKLYGRASAKQSDVYLQERPYPQYQSGSDAMREQSGMQQRGGQAI